MKIGKHRRLIRAAQGWLRSHRHKLNKSEMKVDTHTAKNTTDPNLDQNMNTTEDNAQKQIENVQQQYWRKLQHGLPKPQKPAGVEMVQTEINPEPVTVDEYEDGTAGFDKHHYMSEKMVELILNLSGIELTSQEAVEVFANNPRFLEAREAGVQAHKYMLGLTYGFFYYNKLATHRDCVGEWHRKFITGAGLSLHDPVLNCRNKIASWHRKHGTSSIDDHSVMMDILESHFRQFVASRATKQAA